MRAKSSKQRCPALCLISGPHLRFYERNAITKCRVEDTKLEAKDQKNPRPRTAFPRTDPLEAKDRNARGQGHSCKCSKKKGFQKSFSGNLQFIGVTKIFDWGGPSYKSHAMTSSKIFKRGTFCGTKIS